MKEAMNSLPRIIPLRLCAARLLGAIACAAACAQAQSTPPVPLPAAQLAERIAVATEEEADQLTRSAEADRGAGRLGEALRKARLAVAIRQRLNPNGFTLAFSLVELARVELELRQPLDAVASLTSALALSITHQSLDSPYSAMITLLLGEAHQAAGDFTQAEARLQQSLTIAEKFYGPEHARTAERLITLARLYWEQEQDEQAAPLYARSLALSRKAHGDLHPQTAALMSNLASSYKALNRFAEAEALYVESLEAMQRTRGVRHPDGVLRLLNVSGIYLATGRYAKAEPLLQQALEIADATMPPGHDLLGGVLARLGEARQGAAHYAEAEALLLRAVAISEKAKGSTHPTTGVRLGSLANLYRDMGRHAEAGPLYERALAIAEKAHGEQSVSAGNALHALAGHHAATGDNAKAETALLRALAIAERVEGVDHISTAGTLVALAGAYSAMDRHDKAETLILRAVGISEMKLGREHRITGNFLQKLAGVYESRERHGDAVAVLRRAVVIGEQAQDGSHPGRLGDLARQYRLMGHYDEALRLASMAIAAAEKVHGADHYRTAAEVADLAEIYAAMGRFDQAEPAYRRALDLTAQTLGEAHPTTVARTRDLATMYTTMARYADAERIFQQALTRAERVGPRHPVTGAILNNMGLLYEAMGRYDRAEQMLARSLAIVEANQGAGHTETAKRMSNLGRQYRFMGQYPQAETLFQRALAINEQAQGPRHPATGYRLANLAELYRLSGRLAEAEPLFARAIAIAEVDAAADPAALSARLNNLAKVYLAQGRHDRAEALAQRALATASGGEFMPIEAFEANASLARIQYAKAGGVHGLGTLAIFHGKHAVNVFQKVRSQSRDLDAESKRTLLQSNQGIYEELAGWLVEAGRLPEAQQILAMLKEQEYHAFSRRDAAAGDPRGTSASFTGVERDWAARQAQANGRFVALAREAEALAQKARSGAALTEAEQARRAELRPLLDAARKEVEGLIAQIVKEATQQARSDGDKAAIGERGLPNLRALQTTLGRLGSGAVLIHTVAGRDRLSLILTTPQVQVARHVAVKDTELNQAIAQLRQALENPALDPRPAAARLHGWIIAPLREELAAAGARTLMFSLDGALRYVPMAALHDGSRYLAERYAVALYTEAARDKLQQVPAVKEWSATGFGLTTAHAGFSELPSVAGELRAIIRGAGNPQGALPGQAYLDRAFTQDRLRDALESGQAVLHIASHFQFGPGTDADSFLLLGDGSRLTLADMRSMQFPLELLTLSACQTAVGDSQSRDANGREVEGFAVLAQRQGAAAVLATLWSVADASTGAFMQEMYRLKVQSPALSKAEALRQVQQAFIAGRVAVQAVTPARGARAAGAAGVTPASPYVQDPAAPFAHPFFWAPFVLMGNWL